VNAHTARKSRHPRLDLLAQRGARLAELAIERIALNAMDPNAYPLPKSPISAERTIKQVIEGLPAARRQQIFERARAHRGESAAARRARLGDVARVDIRSNAAIGDQVAALGTPPSLRIPQRDYRAILEAGVAGKIPGVVSPSAAAAPATKLEFRLETVECLSQTFKEKGGDEICVTLVLLNEKGETSNSAATDLGSFVNDSTRTFNDRLLHSIDVSNGTFPKAIVYFPVLVERDNSSLAGVLSLIGAALALIGGVAGLVGLATGNVVLALIGLAVELVGGLLVLLSWFAFDTCIVTEDLSGVLVPTPAEAPGDLATTTFFMKEQENFFGNADGLYNVTTVARLA
jgi:hypothetical protein